MKTIGFKDLKNVAILKDLPKEALNALSSITQMKEYGAGEYIVKQGEKAKTAFIITRGAAEVVRKDDKGNSQILTLVGPGDIIGVGDKENLNESWVRSANVITLDNTTLYEFNGEDYLKLINKFPEVEESFKKVAKRMSFYSFIKKLFPFAAFNYRKIREIANLLKTKEVPSGTTIIREGDESDVCFFILEGEVEISHLVDGKKHVLKKLKVGEILGESAILENVKRTATVITTKDCTLLEAVGEELKGVIYQHSDLSEFYLDIVQKRMRPKRRENVEVATSKSGEKESAYVLKNPETQTFYLLTELGYKLWLMLDGESTISELIAKLHQQDKSSSEEFVTQLVYDLTSHGFLHNPADALKKAASKGSNEESSSKGLLGFLSNLKQKLFG